ncbi:hypothetical protein PanWU01x14_218500 [Parasponia andersonii]|uniref:Uncharacterized protein n=1 Tax=Parasponia andersonii TaxID=3476 RepID=A0A2P5BQQ5_PARAD|nr:hypothetical protein PanWU01x14_218500 [Parasponia andersonii]
MGTRFCAKYQQLFEIVITVAGENTYDRFIRSWGVSPGKDMTIVARMASGTTGLEVGLVMGLNDIGFGENSEMRRGWSSSTQQPRRCTRLRWFTWQRIQTSFRIWSIPLVFPSLARLMAETRCSACLVVSTEGQQRRWRAAGQRSAGGAMIRHGRFISSNGFKATITHTVEYT